MLYTIALAAAPFAPRVAVWIYALVALAWFIPDRRIERTLRAGTPTS